VVLAVLFVDSVLGRYGYAAVFAFVGIESLGIPFPGETMLVSAALYAGATHQLDIVGIIVAAAAGAIIGDNIGYGLGHWGGYRLLLRYGRYIRLHEGRVKLARYLFLRHGGKVVFFGRFVSVLRTYAASLAGTARMPWVRFLVFNATGGIVWATIYGAGSYLAGSQIQRVSKPVDFALGGLAVVVVVALIVVLRRQEQALTVEAERVFPGPLSEP
jgi:membrane protein DedA with SNARE-associated domain